MPTHSYDYVVPNLTGLDRDERLDLALNTILDSPIINGQHLLLTRQAAIDFDVAKSTLSTRYNGAKSRKEAHKHQQKLTNSQEQVLVNWVKVQARRGVPISPSALGDHASAIGGAPIGKSWPQRFMERHPDLKTRWTQSLEKCRASNVNRLTINHFYNVYEELMVKYDVPRENIYNMDEKGIQLEDGNQELVTVLECVCADGTSIAPAFIFKGQRVNLEWGKNNPLGASISCSPNRWTDQEFGLSWMEKVFEPLTAKRNTSGKARILILDGHTSHCTYKFTHFAEGHNILIICLPSHTTHVLQPCDVGVFGPLSTCWKSEVNKQAGHIPITKYNLIEHYAHAREKGMKTTTIEAAFHKTGIWPLNRDALDSIVFEPALNTTTQAAPPLPTDLSALTVLIKVEPVAPSSSDQDSLSNTLPPFRLAIPDPVRHTASRKELFDQNKELFGLLRMAEAQIQADVAKLKLMENENERIRQRAFAKEKRKGKDK